MSGASKSPGTVRDFPRPMLSHHEPFDEFISPEAVILPVSGVIGTKDSFAVGREGFALVPDLIDRKGRSGPQSHLDNFS